MYVFCIYMSFTCVDMFLYTIMFAKKLQTMDKTI